MKIGHFCEQIPERRLKYRLGRLSTTALRGSAFNYVIMATKLVQEIAVQKMSLF